ncbi:thermonuclease family protein [Rhizobium sp. ZW T2_16]|uniref:thermonuclease family protein n=1 Tax=Rhizobium sp. ZW T2_16 TaxID=3378083 RepID=UPI003852ECBD
MLKYIIISCLVAFVLPANAYAFSDVRIVDGDTIDVDNVRYRLHGIDAPEAGQSCKATRGGSWNCGKAAIEKLETLIAGRSVRCEARGKDAYSRVIGVCFADKIDINSEMVAAGMAWAFRRYSIDYVAVEEKAQADKIGIWQKETQTAWDYRAARWASPLNNAPDPDCPIKGNINRKQEKIYHTPWSKDYAKTKIDTVSGERWFCSEDEAIEAGWRAPAWGH